MRSSQFFPAKYEASSISYGRKAALCFAIFAWPWAGIIGAYVGTENYFVLGDRFWYTIFVFVIPTFAGAFVSHLIFSGYRGLVRCAMSGGATPWFATLFGVVLTGWGTWGNSSIHEFAVIGPLFTLPGAVYGAIYWLIFELIRK